MSPSPPQSRRSLPIRSIKLIAILAVVALGFATSAEARPIDRQHRGEGFVAVPLPTAKALRFHQTGLPLWLVGRVLSLAVPGLILLSGLSSRISRFANAKGRPRFVAVGIYAVIFLTLEFAINLPWRYFAGFLRAREYGLSIQPWHGWLGDVLKGLGVEVVVAVLILWVPYTLMARSPRRWWLYTGLLLLPFSAFSALIAPVWVDPLYNQFGPMKDKPLEARIDTLARRAGIDGGKIFEVDKSRETTTLNAYVTGLAGTKRVVLWDTLLAKLDDDEVLAVMGHEMGHYVLNHVIIGLGLSCLAGIVGLYVIHRLANALIARFGRRFGFSVISDVASVPLLIMILQGLILLTAPISNAVSQAMEHEADRFSIEITRSNHAAASAFAKLQVDNLSLPYPDRFTRLWRSTHPAIGERIEFCNQYRPWEIGQPLRYEHLFRER